MKKILLIGGSGFVGYHLTHHFIKQDAENKIFILDINKPISDNFITPLIKNKKVVFTKHDVKDSFPDLKVDFDIIINLAAVHREPGHKSNEYYENNILGSEHTLQFAKKNSCKDLIFFSSISTYGPTENKKNESSLTEPKTPYGISKLISEYIHKLYVEDNRKLLIVRPGVIYGKYENGNVSRMIKALKNNYFFYTGNKNVIKSGIYVKEICHFIDWYLNNRKENAGTLIANLSLNPIPKLEDYVISICSELGKKKPLLNFPHSLLQLASYIINIPFIIFSRSNPFDPVRIKKLKYSNNIYPKKLEDLGYEQKFTILESFQDWKKDDEDLWK